LTGVVEQRTRCARFIPPIIFIRRGTMSKRPLSRRQFLQMSAVGTAGALLAACAPATTAPAAKTDATKAAPPKAETATITFMGWGATEEDEGVKAAIVQFEKEQSEVKVTWLHTPENYVEKFLASVAAGNPPDTAFIGYDNIRTYSRDGLLLDITNFVKSDPLIGAKDYFIEPQETNRCTYKGKWYGIGSCWVAPHIYYNADTLEKAGIPLPSSDPAEAWDWPTFLSYAQKLTVDKNGKNATESGFDKENVEKFGVSWPTWQLPLHAAIQSNGGLWMDPDTNQLTLDKPEAMEAIQRVYDLSVKEHVAPSDEMTTQLGMSTVQMLENGKLAIAIDGSWALSWMYKMKGKLGCAVLPKMKVPATDMQAHIHCGLAKSKNPEAAWKWVRFLSTPFYQTMFCKMGLWLPSQTALLTPEGLKTWITPGVHPDGYEKIVTQFVAKYGHVQYMPAGYPKTLPIMQPAWDKIRIGEATAAEALPPAVAEANKILAEENN
jgi:multiple sugar transport system substrate-binding protein